jgi:hypothetical protein
MANNDWAKWDQLKYRRRLETFGVDDGPGTQQSAIFRPPLNLTRASNRVWAGWRV